MQVAAHSSAQRCMSLYLRDPDFRLQRCCAGFKFVLKFTSPLLPESGFAIFLLPGLRWAEIMSTRAIKAGKSIGWALRSSNAGGGNGWLSLMRNMLLFKGFELHLTNHWKSCPKMFRLVDSFRDMISISLSFFLSPPILKSQKSALPFLLSTTFCVRYQVPCWV